MLCLTENEFQQCLDLVAALYYSFGYPPFLKIKTAKALQVSTHSTFAVFLGLLYDHKINIVNSQFLCFFIKHARR